MAKTDWFRLLGYVTGLVNQELLLKNEYLVAENRILAYHGLLIMQETQRTGLRALMEVAGIKAGQPITPVDVSYRLGPRINASGRLADAALSVELLVSDDTAPGEALP